MALKSEKGQRSVKVSVKDKEKKDTRCLWKKKKKNEQKGRLKKRKIIERVRFEWSVLRFLLWKSSEA